jgi:acetyl-CoA C-acetyltransferase
MGTLAEYTAARHNVSRADQDAFAAESHRRAVRASSSGKFSAEIAPVTFGTSKGETTITADEGPRPETNEASLAKLRPAFDPTGTVTAGNASQISDGAAALIVASKQVAREHASAVKARIVACAVHSDSPKELFTAPVGAVEKALDKAGLAVRDIDLAELNEAFAVQCLACMRPLGLSPEQVNVHGGAIALGHPIGASGARVLVTLLYALADRGLKRGLAALCLGGGEAVAMIVERM